MTGTMEHAVHGSHRFQGAIFDVDGVLVDSPHYRAWRDALQELMAALGVARLGDTELLADAGADLVVRSLDEVSRPALAEGRLERKRKTEA